MNDLLAIGVWVKVYNSTVLKLLPILSLLDYTEKTTLSSSQRQSAESRNLDRRVDVAGGFPQCHHVHGFDELAPKVEETRGGHAFRSL